MIPDPKTGNIGFEFGGTDEYCAEQPWLLSRLEAEGMLFLLELRQNLRPKAPIFSLQDALEALRAAMPRKSLSFEDAADLIREHHQNSVSSRKLNHLQPENSNQKSWISSLTMSGWFGRIFVRILGEPYIRSRRAIGGLINIRLQSHFSIK